MKSRGDIATATALGLLNPHAYLDTVISLVSCVPELPDYLPLWFALDARAALIMGF